MSETEFPQPETKEVSERSEQPPPPVPPSEWRLLFSQVGDIIIIPADHDIPDGWLKLDGATYPNEDWPEFERAMGIEGDTHFTLPKGMNTDVQTTIIKMR